MVGFWSCQFYALKFRNEELDNDVMFNAVEKQSTKAFENQKVDDSDEIIISNPNDILITVV